MSVTSVFLDAGVFVAAVAPNDAHHAAARSILESAERGGLGKVYTSDYVLAEAWNYIQGRIGQSPPAEAVRQIAFGSERAPPILNAVLRVHSGRFAAASDRYHRHFSSGLSFTDWTSLVCMEEAQIPSIAAFDGGFRAWVDVVDG